MKVKSFRSILLIVIVALSFMSSLWILIDSSKPDYYNLLFLVPLLFGIMQICSYKIYNIIPENLAVFMIIMLFFCRMVVSPFFMSIGNYESTIKNNLQYNTDMACLLICYEAIVVFLGLNIFKKKKQNFEVKEFENLNAKGQKKYLSLVSIILMILIICYKVTPQLSMMYRSVFDIKNQYFTNQEDSFIIDEYGQSFFNKLFLVIGMYLMRASLLIIPAVFIILLYQMNKNNVFSKILSYMFCLMPLLFISGAIARSLIYIMCLILLRNYLFDFKSSNKKIIFFLGVSIVIIVYWWFFNAQNHSINSMLGYFSERFSSYFSGVNIVSGVFNLPSEIDYKIRYFIYDFITTLPFGNTIFGIKNMTVQPFFNLYNNSYGQIPPTIGMGYYYFGPVLAPIYSIIFAFIAFKNGERLRLKAISNSFQYIRILYTIFVFSMGMTMYNIEITMTNVFCLIIPMLIMEKIAYKGEKNDT